MAGVPAGRLSIEIVAEIARLQQDLDKAKRTVNAASGDISRSAKSANDNLAGIGRGAMSAASDIGRLKAQLDPAWASQQKFNQQQELAMRALKAGAIDRQQFIQHMRQINAEMKGVQGPMGAVTKGTGAQSMGMKQLGFQINDVATQFASGTKPMQIFAQQGGQVVQAVQMMTGGTSKLGAFLGGPWGVALTAATIVLVPLIGKLFEASAATDELREAEAKLASSIGTLVASRELLDEALGRNKQNYAELRLRALEAGAADLESAAKSVTAAQIRVKAAQAERNARDDMLQSAEVAAAGGFFNPFGFGSEDNIISSSAKLKEKAAALNEASAALNKLTADLVKAQGASGRFDKGISGSTASTRKASGAASAHAAVISEAQKAYDQATESAKSYAERLEDQIAKFGKSALEIQRMEVAAGAAAAPTAELAKRITDAGTSLESLQVKKATDDFNKMIVALYNEAEALGMTEQARETAALQLEKDGKMAEWLAAGLTDLENKWLAYAAARLTGIDTKSALERDADAAELLKDRMDGLVGSFGGIGGLFGDIGKVLTSKDPIGSLLGMGGIGSAIGSILDNGKTTAELGKVFGNSLRDTFGIKGELAADIGGTLANLFQGASIGGGVASILGGGKGGALGGSLGGAAGQALGSTFSAAFGKLASAAGPIGAIAGAILGNVLGGMIGGTKRGGATIGASGISGTWGNSDSRIGAASDLGGSAVDALSQLASALGVPLGSFSSSVSVRKNDLRFDPTGSGISKTSKGAISFGQDEEALLKAVIKDAISDGAFEGLSQGFKDYLTSGDVESRLQDVLNLKGVMNEAAQMRDPQGFALGELDKWRTSMLAIATATGEGMADVEYVYGERRKEILEAANDNSLEIERERTALLIQIAELEGRSTEALAMARELERSQVDESLRPLMDRIYALQDEAVVTAEANAAIEAALQAERDLAAARQAAAQAARSVYEKQVGIEAAIMTLQGNAVGALRVQRELELYAAEATLRPLLMRKYALEDEATAAALAATEAQKLADEQAALAEAQRKAAEEAAAALKAINDEIGGLNRQWLETIGDTKALRELDLAALLSDEARAIQQRIWDYTDALEAQEAAQEAAAKAAEDYTNRLAEARDALSQAYERESGALQQTIDKFRDFAATIREFRMGLIAANDNSVVGARSRFLDTARMAAGGDSGAVSGFAGSANSFLETALGQARTRNEYQDQVAFVQRIAGGVEGSLGGQAGSAQMQLDLLKEQVGQFISLNENVLTVKEAIANLQAIEAEQLPVVANTVAVGLDNVAAKIEAATAKAENAEAMSRTALEAILKSSQAIERKLGGVRVEGGAWTVRTDDDTPLQTVAA